MADHVTREITTEAEIYPALTWAQDMLRRGITRGPVVMTLGRQRRSLDQNAKLWAMLSDIANQVEWYGQTLTPEAWKDVFTAGLKRQEVVPGIDGGFVVIGAHTSRMDKETFGKLLDLIQAFGDDRGVEWSDNNDGETKLAKVAKRLE